MSDVTGLAGLMPRRARTGGGEAVSGAPWVVAPGVSLPGDVGPWDESGPAAVHVIASRHPQALRAVTSREAAADRAGSAEPAGGAGVDLTAPQVRFDEALPSAEPQARRGRSLACVVEETSFTRSVWSVEPVSDVEASAFAGRFAADFQSFDEDVPGRRAEVLREVLADAQAATWGWSGAGRQRADSPLPGRIYRRSDTVVFVEVVVRVTPYIRTGAAAEAKGRLDRGELVEPSGTIGRSCAPPETDAGWTAVEPRWVRMTVPVTRAVADGRLVVDPGLLTGPSSDEAGR